MTTSVVDDDQRVDRLKASIYLTIVILGGQVLLPLVLLTFVFSSRVNRLATLLTFLLSWVVFSMSATLLLYTGHWNDPTPPRSLCFGQQAFMNGTCIWVAYAAAALVLDLRLAMPGSSTPSKPSRRRTILLILLPMLPALVYEFVVVMTAIRDPNFFTLERGPFWCRFATQNQIMVAPTIVASGVILAIVIGFSMFYRTLTALVSLRRWTFPDSPDSPSGPWSRTLIRLMIFCVYTVLTFIVCIVIATTPEGLSHDIADIFLGCMPMVAFLVFGTGPDIRQVWLFWRKPRRAPYSNATASTITFKTGEPVLPVTQSYEMKLRSDGKP